MRAKRPSREASAKIAGQWVVWTEQIPGTWYCRALNYVDSTAYDIVSTPDSSMIAP